MESKEAIKSTQLIDSKKSDDYFESYDSLDVHKLMLEDRVKNEAYKDAIEDNKQSFRGRVVLDIGAGTGILSALCAKAGAKTVYAVEASKIYKIAEETAKENNYEHIIKVINAPIESVDIPEEVDIIVSEWMGFYLLHEGMIASVIYARDKFLKKNGLIFPSYATLLAAPCSVPSYFDFWENAYGISMNHFGKQLRESVSDKPIAELMPEDCMLAKPNIVAWIDLNNITLSDIQTISIRLVAVATKKGQFQGICLWFDCEFPSKCTESVMFSTAPDEKPTHWKQTTIVLPESYEVIEGTPIAYELLFTRSRQDLRKYKMEVTMLDEADVEHPEDCRCSFIKCLLVRECIKKYEEANTDE